MSIQWGNPIVITSGTTNALLENTSGLGGARFKVKQVQWLQPTLESTSGCKITKYGSSSIFLTLQVEVSGQSQVLRVDQWWNMPFIDCVATGTLQIFLW